MVVWIAVGLFLFILGILVFTDKTPKCEHNQDSDELLHVDYQDRYKIYRCDMCKREYYTDL